MLFSNFTKQYFKTKYCCDASLFTATTTDAFTTSMQPTTTEAPVDPWSLDKKAECESAFVLDRTTTYDDALAFPVTVWEAYYTPFLDNEGSEIDLTLATE